MSVLIWIDDMQHRFVWDWMPDWLQAWWYDHVCCAVGAHFD